METIVYLIRHSTRFDTNLIETYRTDQSKKLKNEKIVLSVEGEKRAEILSKEQELQNLDIVYTSNYARTLQTAKYILESQNLKVHIDNRFDERYAGIPNDTVYPNWYKLQYQDESFKTVDGESQKEVRKRFEDAFNEVVNSNKGKRIAIFSHELAITYFLLKWCKLEDINDNKILKYSFKNKIVLNKAIDAPEVFKLILDNNNDVKEIINIEFDDLK